MADNKEFYRLDLVISTKGVEEAEKTIKAMDKMLEQTQRRATALGKTKIKPDAVLTDKTSTTTKKVVSKLGKLDKTRANPEVVLTDKTTSKAKKVISKLGTLDDTLAKPEVELVDKATGSADKIKRKVKDVDKTTAKPKAQLVDRVSAATGKISSTLTGLTRKTWRITVGVKNMAVGAINGIKNTLFSLPSMLAAGGATYGGVVAPLNLAGQMEQANIAFETMLKSQTKAQAFMEELKDFAERTPFDFAGLRDNAQRMLAFKWKQEDILPDLTTIGDWAGAMGKGKEGIDRVTLAFGQMRAKGRIQGDEMLQLTEAGINAYDYLAKAMGISTAAVMDLQSQGLLPAEQSIQAILKGMQKDFGGGMKKQESTLLGLWNRMKEVFSNKLLFRWGEGIRLAVQPRLQKIGDWLDNNEKTIQHWGDVLQKTAKKATDWVADKFEKVMRLGDDPAFQNADFFGKVGIVWDTVIGQSFSDWWSGSGQQTVTNISSKIGEALGGGLKGFIMGALGIVGGESEDESVYVTAGRTAGEAFFKSFLEALDPGEILKKLGNVVIDKNTDVISDPSVGNIAGALATDIAVIAGGMWGFNKLKNIFKGPINLGKLLFGGSKAGGAAGTAAKVAETATRAGTTAAGTAALSGAGGAAAGTAIEGSAAGMSRVATYGTRAGLLSATGIYGTVAAAAAVAGIGLGEMMNQGLDKVNELREKNTERKETWESFNPEETKDWAWVQNESPKWYEFDKKFWNWTANTEIAGVDMSDVFGQPKPVADASGILNFSNSPFNKYPDVIKPFEKYESDLFKLPDSNKTSIQPQTIQIPEEQIQQIVTPLNEMKKEVNINVNMPQGMVTMTVQKDEEIDIKRILDPVGQRIRDAMRSAQQNIK